MKALSYLDTPCERCGSKRRVAKTWIEKVPNLTGTTTVEFSQIVCTNEACQKTFDENLKKEKQKRESLRQERESHMQDNKLRNQRNKAAAKVE